MIRHERCYTLTDKGKEYVERLIKKMRKLELDERDSDNYDDSRLEI